MMCAQEILQAAGEAIGDRAATRDCPEGERSMPRCVRAFNDLTGHNLSYKDGWLFLLLLKIARSTTRGGKYNADDLLDATAYAALAGEQAEQAAEGESESLAVAFSFAPDPPDSVVAAMARQHDED